ncbi:MAG: hypothetical protein ACREXR_15360 [Gammaproteobacteria bacterium]
MDDIEGSVAARNLKSANVFEAGQNSAANRLTLPRRIMPGEYVVEHRVRSGTSYDTARSDFSVVRD